ncbi:hypothetical protein SCATT_50730 [Streptantibioticus cattleyicolor NRRL 8057 = DSM 46488]|uniref:Uncharacterized protein n=1 Tax=Streptantibioticus cattleyicolor (strain ATCC 35852 / DSM 46488 / JCM 4925 / NBRC 14057 / NRRL 8057) TaxID=1003195 RepID=G8WVC0_STREN|nr:hypothetical protein SCATT_50730 [Streptantibioticus cattleyicolor NRRL 8057 = DSM 46488]
MTDLSAISGGRRTSLAARPAHPDAHSVNKWDDNCSLTTPAYPGAFGRTIVYWMM